LAFRQSKIYIRLGPADHNLFSETVIGSEPPFQKSSKPVVATSETDFFRHRFLRETLRETGTDNISDSVWPSFRVLSFTRRCPLPPRHRVTAPASPGNNEGLTVEVPRAFKLPRYGVLGCLDPRSSSLGQTAYPLKCNPWHPRSLSAVSEARQRDQSAEWQRRCPARFRYSDLKGGARVCGGRGQIMGFEWGSADPRLDREKSGMAVCGRERVCYPLSRYPLEIV
jgi:hypothetical protein